jgi:uncharacterized protein (DUF305 family)
VLAEDDDGSTRRRGLLPPPTRGQLIALVAALCFLTAAVGWFLGRAGDGHADRDSADVGFLYDMMRHHEQAVAMSSVQLREGNEPMISHFADEIIRFQSYEIGLMEGVLARLGHERRDAPATAMGWMGAAVDADEMPGLASEAEMAGLRTADDVDAWFVALMIDHHAGGAAMAEDAAARAEDPVVRQFAETMARNQWFEITEMLREAQRIGLDLPPDGVRWDAYGVDDHVSGHG